MSSSTLEELVSSNQERYDSLFPPPLEYSIPQHTSDGTRNAVYFTHVPSSLQKDSTTTTIADVEEDVMKRIYKNDNKYQEKPLLVFLPGLDGVGVSALSQYESLCEDWDVWRMTIDPSSSAKQPSYLELTNAVTDFLEHDLNDGRDIYLMGESFGGLLTTTVALRCSSIIKGLVLINPATSFEDTSWSNIVPLIQALNNPTADPNNLAYSAVASTILSNALLDEQQWKSITTLIGDNLDINLPSVLMGSLQIVGKQLPPSTLQHRLTSWLPVGAQLMTPKRLKSITTPTIIMTGDQDKLLPSGKERRRLSDLLPNCESVSFEKAGHLPLANSNVNLSKLILESELFFPSSNKKKKYDAILDWKLPSQDIVKRTIESNVKPLRDATSPIFFSTNQKTGKRVRGLSQLPSKDNNGNPVLYVANHQLLGLDLGMIIAQLLEERDIIARGLAHPFVFTEQMPGTDNNDKATRVVTDENNNSGSPFSTKLFETFGAVMVTPRNYYRLMQTGQTALLFPGGVREVFHGKEEAYQLFWPKHKVDFVRTAAKFNATIVPLSAVGAADSANILIDAPDMKNLFNNNNNNNNNNNRTVKAARYDVENDEDELFQPPLVVPKLLPARHYFVFGSAIDTSNIHPSDKDACKEVYEQIQTEMYRGFNDILNARTHDIYNEEPLRRLALERITGKQAPTFPLELMNTNTSNDINKTRKDTNESTSPQE